MRERRGLAVLNGENQSEEPVTKDKDGNDGEGDQTTQLIVDSSENGFILSVHGGDDVHKHKVYLFDQRGENGPTGLIQDVIDSLGLSDKVKLQK